MPVSLVPTLMVPDGLNLVGADLVACTVGLGMNVGDGGLGVNVGSGYGVKVGYGVGAAGTGVA